MDDGNKRDESVSVLHVLSESDLQERLRMLNEIRSTTCRSIQEAHNDELTHFMANYMRENGATVQAGIATCIQLIIHAVMAPDIDDNGAPVPKEQENMTRRLLVDSIVAMIEQETEARIRFEMETAPNGTHVN